MDRNEEQTAHEAEADQALSPGATEGASSSDAADEAPDSTADAILREFQETYGDEEPADTGASEDEGDPEDGETDADAEAADTEQSSQKEETAAAAETDDADDDQFRIPDEQFKALPDGVKKRLGHLNTRAKKAERELAEREREMEPLKDAHQRFSQIQSFVQENEIEPQNVTLLFNAAAAMSKGDFSGFVKMVQPWYNLALQASGEAIDPELQQRVDDGYLTEEDAKELTRARISAQASQGKVQSMQQKNAAMNQAQQSQQEQGRILSAVQQRESHLQSSDADYALKSPAMKSMIEFALKSGAVPKTSEEAVRLVDEAYARVNATFKKPTPPKPTPPRPSSSSTPRGNPAPETTKEAITQALRDMPQ